MCLPQTVLCAEAAPPQRLSEEPLQIHWKHISETPRVMTHRAGGELSQIKASKKPHFFFFFSLLNTSLDLDLLVLAHPQHRSFCLIACEASKSLLGHVPYSPAGVA